MGNNVHLTNHNTGTPTNGTISEQARMDRVKQTYDALINYLSECGLTPQQIINTTALMIEYDSAFQAAIEGEDNDNHTR